MDLRVDRYPFRAFTLVELLVVVAIIAIIMALLLPSVQMARESGRRTECANNLRQLGLGSHLHEQSHGFLPSGVWGYGWVGDADLGFGETQPGGWIYSLLPYLEQTALHELGRGSDEQEKLDAAVELEKITLKFANCPSRRQIKLYPLHPISAVPRNPGVDGGLRITRDQIATVAKTCYAFNGGTSYLGVPGGPRSLDASDVDISKFRTTVTGVIRPYGEVKLNSIRDGTASTYLVGEKYLSTEKYEEPSYPGDARSMFSGYGHDSIRWGGLQFPLRRDAEVQDPNAPDLQFGGPHPGVVQFVFCDGSVHAISFDIDPVTHGLLANRRDGQPIDRKAIQ